MNLQLSEKKEQTNTIPGQLTLEENVSGNKDTITAGAEEFSNTHADENSYTEKEENVEQPEEEETKESGV